MINRVAQDKERATDKLCLGEEKLLFQTGADGVCLAFSG